MGYIIGPIAAGMLSISFELFFLAGLLAIFIRLILIKIVYRIKLSNAFSIWIFSAVISFGALLILNSI